MKKTFATSAIATIAAVNLIFSAPLANAATTYTVDHAAAGGGMPMVGGDVAEFDGKAIVKRRDDSFNYHLFATDRSTNTTVELTSEIVSDGRYFLQSGQLRTTVRYDGKFWDWVADDVEGGYDLLYSDGTVAGTGVVEVDVDDPQTNVTIGVADGIYFAASDGVTNNDELFYFDGSTVSDMDVTDNGGSSFPFMLRVFQNKVSFLSFNDSDENVTQYTAAAGVKTLVGQVNGMWNSGFEDGSPSVDDVDANNAYAFTYNNNTESSFMWWTDDPDNAYELVTDEVGGSGVFFNGLYFFDGVADVNNYTGLASADGTVLDDDHSYIYPDNFVVSGDVMYFGAYTDSTYAHWNLYKMGADGVVHVVLQDWSRNTESRYAGQGVGSSFFFQHDGGIDDNELWVDDADGAHLASNMLADGESNPDMMGVVGDEVCFGAFASTTVEVYDLYCVGEGTLLAETGVDAGAIGAAGVLTLIVGGGLAVVRRRSRITA